MRYDYTAIRAEGEAAGLAWNQQLADMADAGFAACDPPLTQSQVESVLRLYIVALSAQAKAWADAQASAVVGEGR